MPLRRTTTLKIGRVRVKLSSSVAFRLTARQESLYHRHEVLMNREHVAVHEHRGSATVAHGERRDPSAVYPNLPAGIGIRQEQQRYFGGVVNAPFGQSSARLSREGPVGQRKDRLGMRITRDLPL